MNCQLTLIKINGDQAILTNNQQQQFIWPVSQLPPDCQPGSTLNCVLVNPTSLADDDQTLARAILNELLKKT
jgi:hypothetical protein